MSDDPTAGAAPAAPEPTPDPAPAPAPDPTPPDPDPTPDPAPEPRKSPRMSARDSLKQTVDKFKATKDGRPRDPQGRFQTQQDPGPGQEPAAEPPAEPAPGEEGAPPAAAPAADGFVRIDLPDGHALRDQGQEFMDVPAQQETAARALVNSWTRRSDVERATAAQKAAADQVAELRRQNARLQAEAALMASGELDKAVDPELVQLLKQAEEHGSPEQVAALKTAIESQRQALINAKGVEADQGIRDQEAGEKFLAGLFERAPKDYHLWYGQGEEGFKAKVAPIIGAYGRHVDARMVEGGQGPDLDEFFREWVDRTYSTDPQVQTAIRQWQQQEQERIRQEGIQAGKAAAGEELAEQRREAATRHGRRPPTAPASGQRQARVMEPDDPVHSAKPGQRERVLRQKVREMGRRFAGR